MATVREIVMWSQEDGGRKLIDMLQNYGAIPRELLCSEHGSCIIEVKKNAFWWICKGHVNNPKRKPKRVRCPFAQSVRKDTFFDKSHLSIEQICIFVNLWLDNAPLALIKKQCSIVSQSTATDWASFCREVMYDVSVERKKAIGGHNKIVEIDESKFGKRKHNRGHHVEGQWVFGGVERETGSVFMVPVEKRDRQTLLPLIREWILPGTTIVSDCWKAYDCLADEGYQHLRVNHSINFVDADTGACTNKIEASWNAAKRTINASGRRKKFYPGYLAKYMFQKHCRLMKLDAFSEFLKAAGQLYDPTKPAT